MRVTINFIMSVTSLYGPVVFPCGIPENIFMNPCRAKGLYNVPNYLGVISWHLSFSSCFLGCMSVSISTTSGVFIAIGVSETICLWHCNKCCYQQLIMRIYFSLM